MKTGQEVIERALRLLGYTDMQGDIDGGQHAELLAQGLSLLNQIYSDLWYTEQSGQFGRRGVRPAFCELTDTAAPLLLSDRAVNDVAPYGLAMLFAEVSGDSDAQTRFAILYNQKRSSTVKHTDRRRDVLPRVYGG